MARPKKRGAGRPKFVPTDKDKKTVEALAAYGVGVDEIALVMGIGKATLYKYFTQELTTSHITANAKVAETAYKMAISGKIPAMTTFWLKTRARWRETTHHEHRGAIGVYDLSKLKDAELDQLEAILGPVADAAADPGGEGPTLN